MKKFIILKPLLGMGCLATAITPTFLTSCNNRKNQWISSNFVEVLYAGRYDSVVPTHGDGFTTDDNEIIQFYLNSIKNNPQILKDEICHTANILRENSRVAIDFGEGREGIFKFQWNIGSVEVNPSAHTFNYTLGVYLTGNWLGEVSSIKYNYFQNLNVYMEIRRTAPLKILSVNRNSAEFWTDENILQIVSTSDEKGGDFLQSPYELTMFGSFWYYNTAGELKRFEDLNVKSETLNKGKDLTVNETIFTQLVNKYCFNFSRYLRKKPDVYDEIYISSKFLDNFKIPNKSNTK